MNMNFRFSSLLIAICVAVAGSSSAQQAMPVIGSSTTSAGAAVDSTGRVYDSQPNVGAPVVNGGGGGGTTEPQPQYFSVVSTSNQNAANGGHPIFTLPFDASSVTITMAVNTPFTVTFISHQNNSADNYYPTGQNQATSYYAGNVQKTIAGWYYYFPVAVCATSSSSCTPTGGGYQSLDNMGTLSAYWQYMAYNVTGNSDYITLANSDLNNYSNTVGDMSYAPSITLTNLAANTVLNMSPYFSGYYPNCGANSTSSGSNCTQSSTLDSNPGFSLLNQDFTYLSNNPYNSGCNANSKGCFTASSFQYTFTIAATPAN